MSHEFQFQFMTCFAKSISALFTLVSIAFSQFRHFFVLPCILPVDSVTRLSHNSALLFPTRPFFVRSCYIGFLPSRRKIPMKYYSREERTETEKKVAIIKTNIKYDFKKLEISSFEIMFTRKMMVLCF